MLGKEMTFSKVEVTRLVRMTNLYNHYIGRHIHEAATTVVRTPTWPRHRFHMSAPIFDSETVTCKTINATQGQSYA